MSLAEIGAAFYPLIVGGVGGFIGAVLLLPTRLGEALFSYRLGKALESFKADQSRDLERLKEELSHFSDRGKRSNEMEFLAIQVVWKSFVKAWLSTNTCVGEMIRLPAFSAMNAKELKSFASGSGLSDDEHDLLATAEDKEKEYLAIRKWRTVLDAGTDIYTARLTLREQRIFMPNELTQEFDVAIARMSSVQAERRLTLENPTIPAREFGDAMLQWSKIQMDVIEGLAISANKRLFRNEMRT